MAVRATADIKIDTANVNAKAATVMRRELRRVATQIRDEAKRVAPYRTGKLRASIRASAPKMVAPMLMEATVTAHARYARFVHEGTRPHVIRARRAQALHFTWHGREVFFKSVHHPGTHANPFLAIAGNNVAIRNKYSRAHR